MASPRILIYSHDTYGLGHLRRNLLIAGRLAAAWPEPPAILIATGSARAHSFVYPEGCDVVKLPSVVKGQDGRYHPRSLGLSLGETLALRSRILVETARAFRPDILLVDHAPAGVEGELLPLLRELDRRPDRPKLVLGLRDVIDEAARVRAEWDRLGAWDLLDRVYDRILVYGDERVTSTARELGLAERLPGRVVHTGYLGRTLRRPLAGADPGRPLVLVTTGGGGDGQAVLRACASWLESRNGAAPLRAVVVTGPFLSPRRQAEIGARLRAIGPHVEVVEFTDHMEELLAQASAIVSMAGYNSSVEALAAGVPVLFVPRETPRLEQRLRAERLAVSAGVEWCRDEEATPGRIEAFIGRAFARHGREPAAGIDLDGLDRIAREVRELHARTLTAPAGLDGGTARVRVAP